MFALLLSEGHIYKFMLTLTEILLCKPDLPPGLDGLCIVHASDLHTRGFAKPEQGLYDVLSQGCDVLIYTGDFCFQVRLSSPFYKPVNDKEPRPHGISRVGFSLPPDIDTALDVLEKLKQAGKPRLGSYAVQGNHDPDDFIMQLPSLGITVLANESVRLNVNADSSVGEINNNNDGGNSDNRLNICGICGHGRYSADIPAALLSVEQGLFTIVASHYPEMAQACAAVGVDLFLAGHTHGGQICLPNLARSLAGKPVGINNPYSHPLATHSNTGRKYASGLCRQGDTLVYTSRGLGHTVVPIRIFCPPEVTRFTLCRGNYDETEVKTVVIA